MIHRVNGAKVDRNQSLDDEEAESSFIEAMRSSPARIPHAPVKIVLDSTVLIAGRLATQSFVGWC